MTYITTAELRTYIGATLTTDDSLIASLIASAQAAVDNYTFRTFEASADSTRYFTVGVDTYGRELRLDKDLAAITTIQTNADAGTPTTLATTDYFTKPRNEAPYYAIVLASSSLYSWEYTDDPEGGIKIIGKWAYSVTAPANIKQATLRWAAYMYKQKDAQVFDVVSIPEQGTLIIPKGMPADVKQLLAPYVKRT